MFSQNSLINHKVIFSRIFFFIREETSIVVPQSNKQIDDDFVVLFASMFSLDCKFTLRRTKEFKVLKAEDHPLGCVLQNHSSCQQFKIGLGNLSSVL